MSGIKEPEKKIKHCVMFSSVYPYETTLKNELNVLSEHFEQIFYIPSNISSSFCRTDFPKNVTPLDLFISIEKNIKKLIVKNFFRVLFIFIDEAFRSKKPFK
jgi:hypothetical protein